MTIDRQIMKIALPAIVSNITVPLLAPTTLFLFVTTFIASMKVFQSVDVMTGLIPIDIPRFVQLLMLRESVFSTQIYRTWLM